DESARNQTGLCGLTGSRWISVSGLHRGLKQSGHALEQSAQGRGGLRGCFDDDLASRLAAKLKLREELLDFAHARQRPLDWRDRQSCVGGNRGGGFRGGGWGGTSQFTGGLRGGAHGVARLVARLDQLLEWVRDLIVYPDVGQIGQLDLLGAA